MRWQEISEAVTMKLYHGTPHDFDRFDPTKSAPGGAYGAGIYLSNDFGLGRQYSDGKDPVLCTVTLEKPWIVDLDLEYVSDERRAQSAPFRTKGARERLMAQGYDGVIIKQGRYREVVAYYPDEIQILGRSERVNLNEALDDSTIDQWEAEMDAWKPPRGLKAPRPEDIEMFRKAREVVRRSEGGGGMCHVMSEWIEYLYGWTRHSGVVVSRDGEVQIDAHLWNELPDGSILDTTADQLGENKDIEIIHPSDPEYGRYADEWFDDYHPGHPDWTPDTKWLGHRKPEHFTGMFDYDLAAKLQKERGPNWWVTHPEQLRRYLEQQLIYAKKSTFGDFYVKWLQDKLDDLNANHPLTESVESWPQTISGDDLATEVETWHHTPEDFDDGDILQNVMAFGTYHLQRVPLTSLKLGMFTIYDNLVDDYANMGSNAPPIVVDLQTGIIIDGNHRAEAAVKRGESVILAYVGDPSTYDPTRGEEDDEEWHPEGEW